MQKRYKKELQKRMIVQKNEKSGAGAQREYCTLHVSAVCLTEMINLQTEKQAEAFG